MAERFDPTKLLCRRCGPFDEWTSRSRVRNFWQNNEFGTDTRRRYMVSNETSPQIGRPGLSVALYDCESPYRKKEQRRFSQTDDKFHRCAGRNANRQHAIVQPFPVRKRSNRAVSLRAFEGKRETGRRSNSPLLLLRNQRQPFSPNCDESSADLAEIRSPCTKSLSKCSTQE